jgi:hypothetical protein
VPAVSMGIRQLGPGLGGDFFFCRISL